MSYLRLKKSNCKNCYKCIRHCPVKSIRFSDGQANIVEDECILCGMCFVACPQNAKQIRNDVGKAKELIASGTPVYVSIAPSFVANYDGIGITALMMLLKSWALRERRKPPKAHSLLPSSMKSWLRTASIK